MAGNDGSREFGRTRPHKQHLVRGSGGVQAEVSDLRLDVDIAFCAYELGGQLAPYRIDVVPPTVLDDITQGFAPFSKWIDSVAGREYTCISSSTGAAVWSETTNLGVVPGGIVASVFGRVGIVTAAIGDYVASLVSNDSTVAGATVRDALDTLLAAIPPVAPVSSVHARTGAVVAAPGDYMASQVTNNSTVAGAFVSDALNTLNTGKALATRNLTAGAGLSGGGDLSADRTFNVVGHPDGSIVANPTNIQVGVLATDAQHGSRGGSSLHSAATPVSSGFMSFSDKAKLDGISPGAQVNVVTAVFGRVGAVAAALNDYAASLVSNDSALPGSTVKDALDGLTTSVVPSTRLLIAGAGLVGGGNLSSDRTFDVVAHADGSIVVSANDVRVGILATDAQHGSRGGGVLHDVATVASAGFLSPSDKLKLDSIMSGITSPWQDVVIDKDLSVPPGGPTVGDRYIVGAGASGDWTAHDDEITTWTGVTWAFVMPDAGFTVYVADEGFYYTFATGWSPFAGDHGLLSGLGDDDHTQYLLVAGTRAMSGNLDMGGNAVVSVGLVDGVDVSAHAARHNPGGVDALATAAPATLLVGDAAAEGSGAFFARAAHVHGVTRGVPVAVGTANAAGSSTDFAGADHVHAHGAQPLGAGTDHAAVVPGGASGFMTGADKTKLDNVEVGAAAARFRQSRQAEVGVNTTTGSLTFITLLTDTITITAGGILLIHVSIGTSNTGNNNSNFFRLVVDGVVRRGAAYTSSGANNPGAVGLVMRVAGLAAGAREVRLEWRTEAGTAQVRPVASPDGEHATMVIEEVTF